MRSGKEAMFTERNFHKTFLIRTPPYWSIRSASILIELYDRCRNDDTIHEN